MMSKKRVAVIVTEYRHNSHADMILGRLLGEHGFEPRIEVASIYTDQVPANDMSREMAAKNGVPICETIEQTIAYGGPGNRVDGIVIVGEHGDYPWNERGQRLYPRLRFMQDVLQAVDKHNIRVPIFLDKHFSYTNENAAWMYEQVKARQIPFMAGSSLPHSARVPVHDFGLLRKARTIMVVSYGGYESYGFHALEIMQSLAEHREGAETGVAAINSLTGDAMWQAMARGEWPEHLLAKALSVHPGQLPELPKDHCPNPALFIVEYKDGTKGYVAMLDKYAHSWTYAVENSDDTVIASRIYNGNERPTPHFAIFTKLIENMVMEGKLPCPPERTLLTTFMINSVMDSLYEQRRIDCPELGVTYDPFDF